MNSFSDRMILGDVGERLVKEWLSDTGYVVFEPATTDRPHWFDFMAHDPLKQKLVVVEVKTKPKLKKYNATGINVSSMREYQSLQKDYSINVILMFVDVDSGQIYYGSLSELMEGAVYDDIIYPNYDIVDNIVLFPIEKMKTIKNLSGVEISEIKNYQLN